eukprot:TRINITY_DN911_c1_g3_i2.p2 TRINITY_DN911_c1_g3~~TRINITY_DN911_c1_g3_i2.p2  ORF type:complete len:202 (-),score=1.04 TRINITY_DN911_c1_g3_i2:358-963(-)
MYQLHQFSVYFCYSIAISVAKNEISDEGVKEIGLALKTNNILTTLVLSCFPLLLLFIGDNHIGDEGAKEIGLGLQKNNALTILDLGRPFVYHYSYCLQDTTRLAVKEESKLGLHYKKTIHWLSWTSVYLFLIMCYCLQSTMILVMKEQRKSDCIAEEQYTDYTKLRQIIYLELLIFFIGKTKIGYEGAKEIGYLLQRQIIH